MLACESFDGLHYLDNRRTVQHLASKRCGHGG